jgi:UDP-N-acetylglucosamine--N-acetylmuramyl-(pentapeptide) pyrophosphoryl-undecaprenol N-acetylglucosamine transferase
MEAGLVTRAGIQFKSISTGPLRGRRPWETALNVGKIGLGIFQALALMSSFKPDVVLATGGYVCVPVVMAAWMRRVPSLIYLPDVSPGMAIKFLSRFTTRLAVTFEEARRYLPANKVVVTGYPVRPELQVVSHAKGRQRLNLPENDKVLVIIGGSRGARSINDAIAASLEDFLKITHVVHVCGDGPKDYPELERLRQNLPDNLRSRYQLYPYLHEEMGAALAAADLVVSRSGASVLGEFPAFGLPSILVPYPYAGAHQELNARSLVDHNAAILLKDGELAAGRLLEVVRELLNDETMLPKMRNSAQALARPEAARTIAEHLRQLAHGR